MRQRTVLIAALLAAACSGEDGGPKPPAAPTALLATAEPGRLVEVSWDPVDGAARYLLSWSIGGIPYAPVAVAAGAPGARIRYALPLLTSGVAYTFWAEAESAAGLRSARSETAIATPAGGPLTAYPLGFDGTPNGFYEYLPPGYVASEQHPLLVDWHGSGENGDGVFGLDRVLASALPQRILSGAWPEARPFVAVFPQNAVACPTGEQVDAFLGWAMARYGVDPRRVFLTGLSCGAFGVWDYLGKHRGEEVAAAALVCGGPGDAFTRAGCGLGEVALWVFHGDADDVVPIGPEQAVMAQLLACPSPPRREAHFTVLPGVGHAAWNPVYDGQTEAGDVFAWLLANAKP